MTWERGESWFAERIGLESTKDIRRMIEIYRTHTHTIVSAAVAAAAAAVRS